MLDEAKRILLEHINKDDRVAVALSGGMDSICLTKILLEAGVTSRENICALHVNHSLRGEASDSDSRFVERFCAREGIEFIGVTVDVLSLCSISGKSIETQAREERRRIFAELINSKRVDKVLLAHHSSDQAESILMHIFRGSGLNGLRGMSVLEDNILRPLLTTSKAQIAEYVATNNIEFVTDKSNLESDYNRNFLRNEILPKIKERWQGVENSLINLSHAAAEADRLLRSKLDNALIYTDELKNGVIKLDASCFKQDMPSTHYIFESLKMLGVLADIEHKHIAQIKSLLSKRNGAKINLGNHITVAKEYDKIALFKTPKPQKTVQEFKLGSMAFLDKQISITEVEPKVVLGELTFDLEKVPAGSVIRTRQNGDIFEPIGGGTKKLKEYLIDKKIPQRLRDDLPCLCYKNEVLLIFGIEISQKIKLDTTTKTAARATITNA